MSHSLQPIQYSDLHLTSPLYGKIFAFYLRALLTKSNINNLITPPPKFMRDKYILEQQKSGRMIYPREEASVRFYYESLMSRNHILFGLEFLHPPVINQFFHNFSKLPFLRVIRQVTFNLLDKCLLPFRFISHECF